MSVLTDQGRRVFALEIGGLIYRYHSGAGCSGLNTQIVSGVNYIDTAGINTVSAFSANIDPSGGVGVYEPITITLNIDKRADESDAGVVFGRCGARSAGTNARITESVARADAVIKIDTDLTSLSYPRLMHIGAETVKASSALSTRLIVSAGRAVANTPLQNHTIDLEGVTVPEVTTQITTFRGRRAKLYCAHQYPDKTLSAWVEVVNGFIESTPQVEQGDSISLSIVPLVAMIDTVVTDKGINQSKLLHGYHHFGLRGNVLEYAMQLDAPFAERFEYDVDHTSTITANTFSVLEDSDTIELDYDVSLSSGLDSNDEWVMPVPHPRYPSMKTVGGATGALFPTSITSAINAGGVSVYQIGLNTFSDSASLAQIQRSTAVSMHAPVEIKQHTITGLKKWPEVISDTLENDGPNIATGIDGGVLKWRLTEDQQIRASKTSSSTVSAHLYLWTHQQAFVDNAPPIWSNARAFDTNQSSLCANSEYRVWYGLDLSEEDQAPFEDYRGTANREAGYFKTIRVNGAQTTNTQKLTDVAKAYYQIYEDRILVESSLGLPTVASANLYDVVVRYYDRASESMREQVFKATHQSTATFSGSNVGFYIHINRSFLSDCISFGDWSDAERALISRGGRFQNERIGTALLQLLSSGGGEGYNSTYDVFSAGCNLKLEHIDEQSFLSLDSASPFTVSGQFAGVGADVREMINSLLKLLGAVMIMRRSSTGASKIALVPIGGERNADAVATINAGDWLVSPAPHWDNYDDIVTQIKYEYDYDVENDEYQSEVIFNNQEAITRYGGEQSQITLTLAGISSQQFGRGAGDVYAEFLPTSARIFNLLSNPLRLWRGSIGTGHSTLLDLGSYAKCTSPHLRGYTDSYGVTDGVAMIKSIRQELMGEGCDLELITTGLTPVAWNSSATVATVPDTTSITVNANDYSVNTTSDVLYFSVGDVVDYVPTGAQDTAITGLTISSIVSNTITFSSAHSISSADGTIEPTLYANASTDHKSDAYLADSSDELDTDTAKEFN